MPTLAYRFRHDRRSARAYHEPDRPDYHDERPDDVYARKLRFARVIGNEKTVYYAVYRRKDHHRNARRHEFQQPPYCEFIGKLDRH